MSLSREEIETGRQEATGVTETAMGMAIFVFARWRSDRVGDVERPGYACHGGTAGK